MAETSEAQPAQPAPPSVSAREQKEILGVYEKLRQAEAKLIGPDGKTEALPNNLYSFLLRLLSDLRAGRAVTILESRQQLTTIEAARILGMSRQFLIKLLERGDIPFHFVGTHRRIFVRDLMAYQIKRDLARRETLDHLAQQESQRGEYDKIPDDFHSDQ